MPDEKLRLLMFNLMVDADDPILGFTTQWINDLVPYCERIDLITMQTGRIDVAANVNVYSVGREKGYGEARRGINFYSILGSLLVQKRYDACFAHMMPLFAGMGGFLLKPLRIPITLWYTHRQVTRQLRLGMAMSRRVVSAVSSSFPIETPKLRALGHGIDTDVFAPGLSASTPTRPLIVQVARLMPIKHQHILLHAAKELDVEIALVGDVPEAQSTDYRAELHQLVDELEMQDRVTFTGSLTSAEVQDWYHRATLAVNLSPVGLFDKAALESMASAVPTLVSNPAFNTLMGQHEDVLLIDSPEDVAGLKKRLHDLLAMPVMERARIGTGLRESVIEQHSRKQMMKKLVNVLRIGELE